MAEPSPQLHSELVDSDPTSARGKTRGTAEKAAGDVVPEAGENAIQAALRQTVVIIPMLNEEDSIGLVLGDLPTVHRVFVVDNGCTDDSPQIAEKAGATVVKENQRGYGAACLAGIRALEQACRAETQYVVFLDGDYSDHPEQITELLAPIVIDGCDFVVGSRVLGQREKGAMLFQALFGNWLACSLMWLFWGAKFTDLGPFRALRIEALQSLQMRDTNYGWTIEMQIKAVRAGLKYTEVPVSYRRRIGVSKISGTVSGTFKAGYKILYTIFKFRLSTQRWMR